jgi:putative ABC transport system permease protein
MVTMQEIVDTSVASRRFQSVLAAGFATVGLLLALLGIYGALSYTTSLRTRELGLRLALGARRGEILREVLGQGGRVAVVGVALGIAVSLGVTRLIGSLLFGVSASDPVTFAAVSALMLATMLAACLLPARRATRVEPLTALRYE